MINIKGNSRKSCGLRKMTVDYISTSNKGASYTSKHDMFKYHTYEEDRGIHEEIMNTINSWMGNIHKKARYEPNDIYEALIDKAKNSSTDFDASKSKMRSYCHRLLRYVFDDISKVIKQGEGHTLFDTFTTESDKKSDESIKTSTEERLLEKSLGSSPLDVVHDQIDFEVDEARHKLVNSLYRLLSVEESAFRTRDSYLNILTYIKAHNAHQHYVELETGTDINHASKRKDIFGTFGMYQNSLKHRIKGILAHDYGNRKSIHGIIKDFLEACRILHIPVMHIDENVVMKRDYIDRLYMLLNNKNVVCVSEYDLPNFNSTMTIQTLITNTVKSESIRRDIPRTKVAGYLMEKEISDIIFNMKVSDFREISKVVSRVEAIHINSKVNREPVTAKKITAGDKVDLSLSSTMEQRSRERTLRKEIVFYHTLEDGKTGIDKIPGPLSEEALKIFRTVVERYRMRLASKLDNETRVGMINGVQTNIPYNEEWLRYLSDVTTSTCFLSKDLGLVVDGNGFVKYRATDYYYEIELKEPFKVVGDKDTRFAFNKYLLHSSGFLVSKFIDGRISSKRTLEIYNANSKGNFENFIIRTIMGEVLMRGYTGK